jgi:hypothetical protein
MSVHLWRLADRAEHGGWPPRFFWRWLARRLCHVQPPRHPMSQSSWLNTAGAHVLIIERRAVQRKRKQ